MTCKAGCRSCIVVVIIIVVVVVAVVIIIVIVIFVVFIFVIIVVVVIVVFIFIVIVVIFIVTVFIVLFVVIVFVVFVVILIVVVLSLIEGPVVLCLMRTHVPPHEQWLVKLEVVETATVNLFASRMLLEVNDGKTWDLSVTMSYDICKVSTSLLCPLQCNYPFFQTGGSNGIFAWPIFGII